MPRAHGTSGDKIDALRNLFKQYMSPEAMTYFWLTVDKEEIGFLDKTYKCVIQHVEAPWVLEPLNLGDPFGEFTAAAMFYNAMNYEPSNARRVAPMAFKYVYGVTPYPTQNNGPLLVSFKDNATNYISTGAEGGIDFTMLYSGVTRDGMDYFNWWWTIDYVQIQDQSRHDQPHHQRLEQRPRAALLRSAGDRHAARRSWRRRWPIAAPSAWWSARS